MGGRNCLVAHQILFFQRLENKRKRKERHRLQLWTRKLRKHNIVHIESRPFFFYRENFPDSTDFNHCHGGLKVCSSMTYNGGMCFNAFIESQYWSASMLCVHANHINTFLSLCSHQPSPLRIYLENRSSSFISQNKNLFLIRFS